MAPVIHALRSRSDEFETIVCATSQHRQMQDQALAVFGISPDVDLDLMRANQSLDDIVVGVLSSIGNVLVEHRPDWILVQGDTSTAFAAALSAFHHGVKIGHVEAGLRTGRLDLPFPEEGNRSMVGRLADLHFAPTTTAHEALLQEGIDPRRVHITGNTVVDALHRILADDHAALPGCLPDDEQQPVVLITGHRRESLGAGVESICEAIVRLSQIHRRHRFVYPMHLNPKVRQPVMRALGSIENVFLTEPMDYPTFVTMMNRATLLITDSGGVQEEATALGIPTLVTRLVTERQEAVQCGVAVLVGTDTDRIVDVGSRLLLSGPPESAMHSARLAYGDGQAATRIVDLLAAENAGLQNSYFPTPETETESKAMETSQNEVQSNELEVAQ